MGVEFLIEHDMEKSTSMLEHGTLRAVEESTCLLWRKALKL